MKKKVGDRVQITSDCQTNGYTGTITKIYIAGCQNYASVKLDKAAPNGNLYQSYNVGSLTTAIYLETANIPQSIEKIKGFCVVNVKKLGYERNIHMNNETRYLCRVDVNINDVVVCEDETDLYKVVSFYTNIENIRHMPTKEIVCVVDYSRIHKIREHERQIREAEFEINRRINEIKSEVDYEYYAEKDAEVANLLKKLNEIKNNAIE